MKFCVTCYAINFRNSKSVGPNLFVRNEKDLSQFLHLKNTLTATLFKKCLFSFFSMSSILAHSRLCRSQGFQGLGYVGKWAIRHEIRAATKDTETCMSIDMCNIWVFWHANIKYGLLLELLVQLSPCMLLTDKDILLVLRETTTYLHVLAQYLSYKWMTYF